MQRICAMCGDLINRHDTHFENEERFAFYCLKCGNRRSQKHQDKHGSGTTTAMLVVLALIVFAWTATVAVLT